MRAEAETTARAFGLEILLLKTSKSATSTQPSRQLHASTPELCCAGAGSFFTARREQIAMLAAGHAIPAMYEFREAVVDCELVSYGTDIADAYRQAGTYTARILRAEKLADFSDPAD